MFKVTQHLPKDDLNFRLYFRAQIHFYFDVPRRTNMEPLQSEGGFPLKLVKSAFPRWESRGPLY